MIPQFAVIYDLALGKVKRIVYPDPRQDYAPPEYLALHQHPGEGIVLIPHHRIAEMDRILAGMGLKVQ